MAKKKSSSVKAKRALVSSELEIKKALIKSVSGKNYSYKTFGSQVEDHASDALIEVFKKKGFIKRKSDYKPAPNKNYFPDFTLLSVKPNLAIDFKSGNHSQLRKGKWREVKNSENDLGTLNSWPGKLKKFGGNNIYFVFIHYNFDGKEKKILGVEIHPFFKFLGLNTAGLLKYREKDGNLRPKNFGSQPKVTSLIRFNDLIGKTICYRSKRIINKHRRILRKTGC